VRHTDTHEEHCVKNTDRQMNVGFVCVCVAVFVLAGDKARDHSFQ